LCTNLVSNSVVGFFRKSCRRFSTALGTKLKSTVGNLSRDVQNLLKRRFPTVDFNFVPSAVENLRQDFLKNPTTEFETRFVYQTAELEKIDSERITRLNLKITVD